MRKLWLKYKESVWAFQDALRDGIFEISVALERKNGEAPKKIRLVLYKVSLGLSARIGLD